MAERGKMTEEAEERKRAGMAEKGETMEKGKKALKAGREMRDD